MVTYDLSIGDQMWRNRDLDGKGATVHLDNPRAVDVEIRDLVGRFVPWLNDRLLERADVEVSDTGDAAILRIENADFLGGDLVAMLRVVDEPPAGRCSDTLKLVF